VNKRARKRLKEAIEKKNLERQKPNRLHFLSGFKIPSKRVDGFAPESVEPEQRSAVLLRGSFTSDDPLFFVYVTYFFNLFFQDLHGDVNALMRFLVVQHEESADIYINDFLEHYQGKATRELKAGERLKKNDLADLKIQFPGISIERSDVVVYLSRVNWKFGLFFDLTKAINVEELQTDLGSLYKELMFQDYLANIEAEITKVKTENLTNRVPESGAFLFTEGKTDWKHIKNSKEIINPGLSCSILEFEEDRGDDVNIKMCQAFSKAPHKDKYVFMFDRDNPRIVKELEARTRPGENFQRWGNNVYSFIIPVPDHRASLESISIEFYYTDEEIRTRDEAGKRLHFSNELKTEVLPTKQVKRIEIEADQSLESTKKIDSDDAANIVNPEGLPVGLSKSAFAQNILNKKAGFDNFNVERFEPILQILETICGVEGS
jgi:RNA-directed DNA polymerase